MLMYQLSLVSHGFFSLSSFFLRSPKHSFIPNSLSLMLLLGILGLFSESDQESTIIMISPARDWRYLRRYFGFLEPKPICRYPKININFGDICTVWIEEGTKWCSRMQTQSSPQTLPRIKTLSGDDRIHPTEQLRC